MEQEGRAFAQALSDFMYDFASGGAIRHMADAGLSVTEIMEKLSFPTPRVRVAQTVWNHYLEKGIILLKEPKAGEILRKVTYVKEQGPYGKVSMRQVVEEEPAPQAEYIPCDFGRRLYQDREGFIKELQVLSDRERQYLLDLPWPLETVWHVKNERMNSIWQKLHRE